MLFTGNSENTPRKTERMVKQQALEKLAAMRRRGYVRANTRYEVEELFALLEQAGLKLPV